jgi:hypothetical protein
MSRVFAIAFGAASLALSGAAEAACAADDQYVFTCTIPADADRVTVCQNGFDLSYSFGPAKGTAEITLAGDVYTDFIPWLDEDAVKEDTFRFQNGEYSYEVISGLSGDDVDYGRVDVYSGSDQLASLECHQPSLFTRSAELYEELNGQGLCWNESLVSWAECPEAEPELAEAESSAPKQTTTPATQAPTASRQTYDAITGTQWSIRDNTTCGTSGAYTDFQEFAPENYYLTLAGNRTQFDDPRVDYFRVDEASRSFEFRILTYLDFAPANPSSITEYRGQLLDDGSMALRMINQMIDFDTLDDLTPRYDETIEESVVWPCDNMPEITVGRDGSSRMIIRVPEHFNPSDFEGCTAIFEASLAELDSPILTVFEEVSGTWYGQNFSTANCEVSMPTMCTSIGGEWQQNPRVASTDPLTLQTTNNGCTSTMEFDFDGLRGTMSSTSSGDCTFGDPYSYTVIECVP